MSEKDKKDNGSNSQQKENKKTDNINTLPWYKETWCKTAILLVLVFILGKQIFGLGTFLILAGIVAIIGSVFSLIKKKKIGKSIIGLIIGLILLPVGSNFMPTNNSTQSAHSAKVQKVNHKKRTSAKTKHKEESTVKAKKVKNSTKSRNAKATTLVATHKATTAKHHQSANKKDAHSNLNNTNTKQATSKQNNGSDNAKGYESQEEYVFVAPGHGKRYHHDPNCRGLKNANSTTKITLKEAQAQGYTPCQINGDN
ncbi:hypothetical protein [Lactobacillus bombicola]|uniref:hypothetical protein n=1 Tax=Lactobacillus bombicola TaxID=1505723 RepID=UPI000E571C35|nr:hypothetical protein [Lactobacillus bombicola]RHW48449.1 hypothetical protein DS833_07940 [Lactobacillus bombicola]